MGLLGILLALALLMWLAYRGWSVLLVAPLAALVAAAISGEPLLAHWTQTFMGGAGRFVAQWFPMFLLGGLVRQAHGRQRFDQLDCAFFDRTAGNPPHDARGRARLGRRHLWWRQRLRRLFRAGAHGQQMFQAANIPRRLIAGHHRPRCIYVHHVGAAGIPLGQQRHSDAVLRHHDLRGARPWASSRRSSPWRSGCGGSAAPRRPRARPAKVMAATLDAALVIDEKIREHATAAGEFDPAEMRHGKRASSEPPFVLAVLPLVVVIAVNFLMSLVVFPRLDFSFLDEEMWGGTTIGAVAGLWSLILALAAATLTVVIINYRRLPALRESLDAGANSSALPILTIASLVGFGAVVAALPAFASVRDAVLSIQGGPLVSLTVAMNVLAGLTGTASGGMAIALNALGDTFLRLAAEHGIDPALMHRVTTISAGTLDALPHNGTVLHAAANQRADPPRKLFRHGDDRDRRLIIALVAVLILGSVFGSF